VGAASSEDLGMSHLQIDDLDDKDSDSDDDGFDTAESEGSDIE
jgi:hypothetical protein